MLTHIWLVGSKIEVGMKERWGSGYDHQGVGIVGDYVISWCERVVVSNKLSLGL